MRALILALYIVTSSLLLLLQPTEVLAASEQTAYDALNAPAYSSYAKRKNHRLYASKQKKIKPPIDVWERIRLSMKIAHSPVETLANQANNGLSTSVPFYLTQSETLGIEQITNIPIKTESTLAQPTKTQSEHILTAHQLESKSSSTKIIVKNTFDEPQRLTSIITSDSATTDQKVAAIRARIYARIHSASNTEKTDSLVFTKPTDFESLQLSNPLNNQGILQKASLTPEATTTVQDTKPLDPQESIKLDRINKHITWFSQHTGYLHQVSERARPYLYHIVESLNQNKLPYELALLPIIESAYQPTALSPKSAAGLWQFIPSTGQEFDLNQTEYYDARLDITSSTQAAMRFLQFLNQHFNGDWLLALAAYNCGVGTVDNAILRNKEEGFNTDYWSLRLPEETQQYVPRFLALSNIFSDPGAHGLKLSPIKNEPYFVKIKIDRKHEIDYLAKKELKEIAQLANLSFEEFNELNPGYINPTLPSSGPFTLLMPSENAHQFNKHLETAALFIIHNNETPTIGANLMTRPEPLVKIKSSEFDFLTQLSEPSDSKVSWNKKQLDL